MKEHIKKLVLFVNNHRLFTLFFCGCIVLNVWLLLNQKYEKTEFISCSSYDKGPLGTFAFFEDLKEGGASVRRLKLSPFRELSEKTDRGKTLIMLSPLIHPSAWEWDMITSWVAKGNRLITSGFFGPRLAWFHKERIAVTYAREKIHPVEVLLPVDSVFPYPRKLSPHSLIGASFFQLRKYTSSDSMLIRYFHFFTPDMLPLLSAGNRPVAVKKAVGRGEWTIFAWQNPFGNTLLRDSTWYEFAVRLLFGNKEYKGELFFDEYHNGYRATKSLWELLGYYRFTEGIIFLSGLILLYLFFTGIRILPPLPLYKRPEKNVIPGLRAMSMLLYRHKAWDSLLKRELRLIERELVGRGKAGTGKYDLLVTRYLQKGRMPKYVKSKDELISRFRAIDGDVSHLERKDILLLFNLLVFIRKELSL